MRDTYVANTDPATRTAALQHAGETLARAMLHGRTAEMTAGPYRALAISPICIDAYAALAEQAATAELSIDLYRRAVHAGTLLFGDAQDRADATVFPAARVALAHMLRETGEETEAIEQLQAAISFDPADTTSARVPLLAMLLDKDDLGEANTLLNSFPDDRSATWLYARLLVLYRDEIRSGSPLTALAESAARANRFIAGILDETVAPFEAYEDEDIAPGSIEEATDYLFDFGRVWAEEPGAIAWLSILIHEFP